MAVDRFEVWQEMRVSYEDSEREPEEPEDQTTSDTTVEQASPKNTHTDTGGSPLFANPKTLQPNVVEESLDPNVPSHPQN